MTPIVVCASLILLIKTYGDLVARFGGTTHPIISAGLLMFAIIWGIGCVYVGLKFAPKTR